MSSASRLEFRGGLLISAMDERTMREESAQTDFRGIANIHGFDGLVEPYISIGS